MLWNLQIFMKQWPNLKGCVLWTWLGNFLAELQNRKDLHLDIVLKTCCLPRSWAKLFLTWNLGGRKFSYTLFVLPVPCTRGEVLVRVAKKVSGSFWGWRGRNVSQDTWEMLWSSTCTSPAGWINISGTYVHLVFPSSSSLLQNPSCVLRVQPSPRKVYFDTIILNVEVFSRKGG